jgi:hypothetical protein
MPLRCSTNDVPHSPHMLFAGVLADVAGAGLKHLANFLQWPRSSNEINRQWLPLQLGLRQSPDMSRRHFFVRASISELK